MPLAVPGPERDWNLRGAISSDLEAIRAGSAVNRPSCECFAALDERIALGRAKATPVAMAAGRGQLRDGNARRQRRRAICGRDAEVDLKSGGYRPRRTSCRKVDPREREESERNGIEHQAGAVR